MDFLLGEANLLAEEQQISPRKFTSPSWAMKSRRGITHLAEVGQGDLPRRALIEPYFISSRREWGEHDKGIRETEEVVSLLG